MEWVVINVEHNNRIVGIGDEKECRQIAAKFNSRYQTNAFEVHEYNFGEGE